MASPYEGQPVAAWRDTTLRLVEAHPLATSVLREAVLEAWEEIYRSRVGSLQIGKDIFPTPQIMATFLHELIPIEVGRRVPGWRRGSRTEKDLYCEHGPALSIEIKTSSSPGGIFGNRSYGQEPTSEKGEKAGYYLAVNFGKWPKAGDTRPEVQRIRFGWIDKADWIPQEAPTGQAAPLSRDARDHKLIDIL